MRESESRCPRSMGLMIRTDALGTAAFTRWITLAQLARIGALDVVGVNALVRAVIDNHQIGMLVLQLFGPLRLVEIADHHLHLSAVQPKTIVDHARRVSLETDAEKSDRSALHR